MNRILGVISILLIMHSTSDAQLLGTPKIFDYIHTPTSARSNAMSGSVIAIQDEDI